MAVSPLNPPQFDIDDNSGVRAYKLRQLVEDLIRAQSELIEELQSLSSGSGSAVVALGDLTDVTLSSLSDRQRVIYDLASSMWVNDTVEHYPSQLGYAGI